MTDKPDLKVVPTPDDADDIEKLWHDPQLGDGITNTHWHTIPIGKPRDFFRVHPDGDFRRRADVYTHKTEETIEETHYILDPAMRGRIEEARSAVIITCVYRDGSPRLWPIPFPRAGEKDNSAWTSARSAARDAIGKWLRIVWSKRSYVTREALPGYAPDPDWGKLPSFNDLVKLAFGEHGIIRDTSHPIYRELMGAPRTVDDDDVGEL